MCPKLVCPTGGQTSGTCWFVWFPPRGSPHRWGVAGIAWYPHTGVCTLPHGGEGTGVHPVHAEWVDTEWLTCNNHTFVEPGMGGRGGQAGSTPPHPGPEVMTTKKFFTVFSTHVLAGYLEGPSLGLPCHASPCRHPRDPWAQSWQHLNDDQRLKSSSLALPCQASPWVLHWL